MLNCLYIIVGKSGSGKITLAKDLEARYGYKLAESYTDRPKRFMSETGHVFVSEDEFSALKGLIAVRKKEDGRYGLTHDMLDHSDLILLDPKGAEEVLNSYKTRPVHVIGVHADFKTRLRRMMRRGDNVREVSLRKTIDDADFMFYEDFCDVVINNGESYEDAYPERNGIVSIAKNIIDQFENQVWVCTDPDCFQYCRQVGLDSNQLPIFELAQVNAYVDGFCRVAHGYVHISDLDDEEIEELAKQYDWPASHLLGFNGWRYMAEAVFESGGTEYDLKTKYHSLQDAARALGNLIDVDVSTYLS